MVVLFDGDSSVFTIQSDCDTVYESTKASTKYYLIGQPNLDCNAFRAQRAFNVIALAAAGIGNILLWFFFIQYCCSCRCVIKGLYSIVSILTILVAPICGALSAVICAAMLHRDPLLSWQGVNGKGVHYTFHLDAR